MKLAVIGYSGSGKSTLSKFLSETYGIPVLFLDKAQFLQGWEVRPADEAKKIVADFMRNNESWVIDGNYSGFYQEERLKEADKIIFLSFNRFSCLKRVIIRYMQNAGKTREDMADGCIEKLDWEFLMWVLREGRTSKKKRHYRIISTKYKEKMVIIKNQRQLGQYMNSCNC